MKFAVISDIHGNFPALSKVVEDAKLNKVDRFIFIGDYIFDLPFSNDVIHCIIQIKNADVINGNKEKYLEVLSKDDQAGWMSDQLGAVYQTYRELSEESFAFIGSLKDEIYIPLESGGCIYAKHYPEGMLQQLKTECTSYRFHLEMLRSPLSHKRFQENMSILFKQENCIKFFQNIDARVVLYGHDHMQYHGYCDDKLIINPGSCGQPLDFDPRASYTILEETDSGFAVNERRVEYDIDAVIRQAKGSKVYECGTIWCEMVFLAMKTAKDHFGFLFEIATKIAVSKGESGKNYSNETWKQAYESFLKMFNEKLLSREGVL